MLPASKMVLLVMLGLVAGCTREAPSGETSTPVSEESRLVVYVVNYPLKYFAQRIGRDAVRVNFPAPADGDPAFWSPDAKTITDYQNADLVLLNGAGYAKWVGRVTLPQSRLIDTSAAFRDRYIKIEDTVTHSHGPTGEHSHGIAAFTTWLDPTLAVEHARAIGKAFTSARPAQAAAFRAGVESLERDLLGLDRSLAAVTRGRSETPLLGSHPVYQYLARRYALNMKSVHFEPDEFPEDKDWGQLEDLLAEHPAKWMLWEGEPLAENVDRLRELGVHSVVFDPCGNAPEEGDYLDIMRGNVDRLKDALLP